MSSTYIYVAVIGGQISHWCIWCIIKTETTKLSLYEDTVRSMIRGYATSSTYTGVYPLLKIQAVTRKTLVFSFFFFFSYNTPSKYSQCGTKNRKAPLTLLHQLLLLLLLIFINARNSCWVAKNAPSLKSLHTSMINIFSEDIKYLLDLFFLSFIFYIFLEKDSWCSCTRCGFIL